MIAIVDYGMGNLRSAQKGLEKAGFEAVVTEDPGDLAAAAGVVLPGVGAFKDCYEGLRSRGFADAVREIARSGKPLLGICVGMQLLFDYGEEGDGSVGLGILPGKVARFPDAATTGLKVPHMGWNRLEPAHGRPCPILRRLGPDPYVYFVHSYYPDPECPGDIYATAEHGVRFAAVVGRGNVFGVQFHPEKSQAVGIGILQSFGEFVRQHARPVLMTN